MRVGIIGAGPAGLSAGYALARRGIDVEVFEAAPHPGGMSRSIDLWGHRVDLGPHRFFSRDPRVNRLWLEILGDDYRLIDRQTRILYRSKLFDYPLKAGNALSQLGLLEAALCVASYLKARLGPAPERVHTFEDWVTQKFGRRLYEMFFKSYSEKLWGIPCTDLSADFAAQRIKGFSLGQALLGAVGLGPGKRHRTLADVFAYPTGGNGEPYRRMVSAIASLGGRLHFGSAVDSVAMQDGRAAGIRLSDGTTQPFDHVISTMPLSLLVQKLENSPADAVAAARRLSFRNTILVYLLVDRADLFRDQWLYVHSPHLQVGRITNFRNWAPELYGELQSSVLAMEYWCNDDDPLWRDSEENIVAMAIREIADTRLANRPDVTDGKVVRIHRCYPVYNRHYAADLQPVTSFLKSIPNLSVLGRAGAFKYNNQDHSLLMGLLAAENIASGAGHDLWALNSDSEYQEEPALNEGGLATSGSAFNPANTIERTGPSS